MKSFGMRFDARDRYMKTNVCMPLMRWEVAYYSKINRVTI
jgi:hypothetical protein